MKDQTLRPQIRPYSMERRREGCMMHNDFAVSRRRFLLWDLKLVNVMFFPRVFQGTQSKARNPLKKDGVVKIPSVNRKVGDSLAC